MSYMIPHSLVLVSMQLIICRLMVVLSIHAKFPLYEQVLYVVSEKVQHELVLVIRIHGTFVDEIILIQLCC